jgi:hypothetical protein
VNTCRFVFESSYIIYLSLLITVIDLATDHPEKIQRITQRDFTPCSANTMAQTTFTQLGPEAVAAPSDTTAEDEGDLVFHDSTYVNGWATA